MELVNFLAQVWGFSIVVVCFSFLVKPKNTAVIFHFFEDRKMLFLDGIINTVLGVALILLYHSFKPSWHIIITLLGLIITAKGVIFLFFPENVVRITEKYKSFLLDWFPTGFVIATLFGCLLVYFGVTL